MINKIKNNIIKTFEEIKKNPKRLIIPGIVDLCFFIIVSFLVVMSVFVFGDIGYRFVPPAEQLDMLAPPPGMEQDFIPNITEMFATAFSAIFIALVIAPIILYLFYSLAQGINFWYHNKKNKINLLRYIGKHYFLNIIWLIIPLLVLVPIMLSVLTRIFTSAPMVLTPNLLLNYFVGFYIFLWLFAFYFGFISYSLALKNKIIKTLKKTFVLGVKKFPFFFLTYLSILALFLIIHFGMILLEKILSLVNLGIIVFILGFFLIFPAISFSRMLIIKSVESLEKKN